MGTIHVKLNNIQEIKLNLIPAFSIYSYPYIAILSYISSINGAQSNFFAALCNIFAISRPYCDIIADV